MFSFSLKKIKLFEDDLLDFLNSATICDKLKALCKLLHVGVYKKAKFIILAKLSKVIKQPKVGTEGLT